MLECNLLLYELPEQGHALAGPQPSILIAMVRR
jgi:hypothetical protein